MQQPSSSSSDQTAVPTAASAKPTTTERKETTSVTTPAASVPPLPPRAPQPEDPYDFDKCTIVAVVQLRPRREANHPRQVLLSAQNGTANKEDLPLYRLLTEDELGGPFPPALVALFEELVRQLPERKQRHEQRMHAKTSSASTPSRPAQKATQASKGGSSQKKTPAAQAQAKPLPPVPAATTPPQKENLVLEGFDWFAEEQN